MNGEVLEVLAKSRGMPICASNLYDLTLEKMTENHLKLVENERLSATFELYGSKNPNDIPYHRFGVDLEMDLLNILDQGMSFPCEFSFELAKQYGIPHDFEHFNVIDGGNVFKLKPTDEFIEKFGEYTDIGTFYADDYLEIYNRLEVVYEEINNNWRTQNKLGHTKEIIMEGSVWHMDNNGTNVMVKNNATSVREGHIAQACGIPHHAISKALFKAKDEMNIYDEDKLVVIAFVKEELSEEFEKDMIEDIKTEQKILSLLKKRQQKLIIDGQLQEIRDNVHDHVGEDANPTDKMRKFAELYPDLTKMSKKVYQAFTNQHLVE
jgi:hypothetical protein